MKSACVLFLCCLDSLLDKKLCGAQGLKMIGAHWTALEMLPCSEQPPAWLLLGKHSWKRLAVLACVPLDRAGRAPRRSCTSKELKSTSKELKAEQLQVAAERH